MPRRNYMTISVSDSVQDMFNEFVNEKGITKTSALSDVLEMYMLAKDEKLYLELKRKYLKVEVISQMISDRDNEIYNNFDFIFMKLGKSLAGENEVNGNDTMKIYFADSIERGYTWFSTQSLHLGMAPRKVKHFKNLINKGVKVKILFGIGKSAGGENDISYSATVLDVESAPSPIKAPDNGYPNEYKDELARIWIKITDIKPEKEINASMLKVSSTGADLKSIITKSQYHFGYVCYK
ncbi:hypothetical protein RI065_10135 [Mycoplasmatota bacterium zrk1]